MQLAVYCQDQALSNSKPWRTHPERVVLLRAATQQLLSDQTAIPRPPATAPPAAPAAAPPAQAFDYENNSTVVIEEVEDQVEQGSAVVIEEAEDKVEEEEVEDDTQHREWSSCSHLACCVAAGLCSRAISELLSSKCFTDVISLVRPLEKFCSRQ